MKKLAGYVRSQILYFHELEEEEQKEYEDRDDKDEMTFVRDHTGQILDMGMFMRFDFAGGKRNPIWDGHYGTSAFDGYFIKMGKTGEEATVARYYW